MTNEEIKKIENLGLTAKEIFEKRWRSTYRSWLKEKYGLSNHELNYIRETIKAYEKEISLKELKKVEEIESTMTLHHTASRRGYLSRRIGVKVEPYEGRFGKGYIVVYARWDTTQYVTLKYYIEEA